MWERRFEILVSVVKLCSKGNEQVDCKTDIEHRVKYYISLKHEGESWDFKREWHHEDFRLLHDIMCMSNRVSDEEGLIIIGVDEENGFGICDVTSNENRRNTQKLVDFLRDKNFAGGIRPEVRVETLILQDKTVDVIVVSNSDNVPFYLSKDFKALHANYIYTRVGDTNTPIDRSADPDRVEKLWKKRFGIDKTAIQRFQIYLRDLDGWDSADGEQSWFYKTYPEFKIEIERGESRNGYEYYCFSQIDSRPGWYNVYLKCWNTVIQNNSAVSIDGARFFTAVPEINTLSYEIGDFFYSYTEGTFQYDLNCFFLHNTTGVDRDSIWRWYECIPVFKSEAERKSFVSFLKEEGVRKPKRKIFSVPNKLDNGGKTEMYKKQYPRSVAIVEMLDEYRMQHDFFGDEYDK